MWVMGSSLRQVTVVPTSTVVVDGLNISELRLITGPAGTDAVLVGAAAADSVRPYSRQGPAAMISEAALSQETAAPGDFSSYPRQLFGMAEYLDGYFSQPLAWTTNVRFSE